MPKLRVAIVGAGVAGTVFAHGLSGRDDVELACFERVESAGQSESGTGLNIGPNAIKSLASLDPELAGELIRRSYPWRGWKVSLTDGTELLHVDLSELADNPGIRIRWSELYAMLRARIARHVAYGVEVNEIVRAADGRFMLSAVTRGKRREFAGFDLIVAADGRYSVSRAILAGKPAVRPFGVANSRVLVRAIDPPLDDLEQWFNGPNRLLAFRVPENLVYISATFPLALDAAIPPSMKRGEHLRSLYLPQGVPAHGKVRFVIDALCARASECHWARWQEAATLFSDPEGRALFLGDAAHPILPTLGQGATQAFEDAVAAVDEARRGLDDSSFDVPRFTAAVAARRNPRVEFVRELSRVASDTVLSGSDPVSGTRAKAAPAFMAQLAKMYRECTLART